ncbi:MAG: excinuclease ABC subunit UvrC [Clostridiales bacterium]|jgi:excinuclease ABC subunit C|nr:excinuclease ABC subunit UvrC [Clostridiales bacterium]
MFDIQEELKKLPKKPGVYLMKDADDNIIYVGKALNLSNRVRQYFHSPNGHTPKVRHMTPHIKEFEYVVTENEVEALILECNLIKKHSPKYNATLKDDKSYPFIKLTVAEQYPRVFLARKHEKDKAKYFGPYTSSTAIRESLDLIQNVWPLRSCSRRLPRDIGKERPCLNYHIGKCKAPCAGKIDETDYRKIVDEVIKFLNGKQDEIKNRLTDEMQSASFNLEFERAAELRDKIAALNTLCEKQKADSASDDDQDVIAFSRANDEALVQVFFIRSGKMVGREHYMLNRVEHLMREEVMSAFVKQFYAEAAYIPKELIVEIQPDEPEIIAKWLSALKGQGVSITAPQKGDKLKLVKMASENASLALSSFGEHIRREFLRTIGAMNEIGEALGISHDLNRVEAYDISNTQGFESVGSMVVFERGRAKNSDYRKFKIKSVIGPDDYASIEEVIDRRFTRYLKELENEDIKNAKFLKLPDILFIDGGKGQVHAAQKALKRNNVNIPVCGMIKDDKHRTRGLWYNEREITLPTGSEGFKLLTRIQDEVHRFAIEYHRKLRRDTQVKSMLDDISGIGPTRRKELMRHFKSLENIRKAEIDDLMQVEGMNRPSSQAVYDFFRSGL